MSTTDFQVWCAENHRYPDAAAIRDWKRGTVEAEMVILDPPDRDLTFIDLYTLTGGLLGPQMVGCPYCGRSKPENPRMLKSNSGSYECVYCAASGEVVGDGEADAAKDAEAEQRQKAFVAGERAEKASKGLSLWHEADSIIGTPAEAYLRQRGITELPPDVDEVLRFHPSCTMGIRRELPCMVALFRDVKTDLPTGIHRTAIPGSWAPGQHVERKCLGRMGAIKLWKAEGPMLVIGEGIETVLSAAQCGRTREGKRLHPAWAMTVANSIRHFPIINDPLIQKLYLLVDNDPSGVGQSATAECSNFWNRCGRDTCRYIPSEGDFNDFLRGGYAWEPSK